MTAEQVQIRRDTAANLNAATPAAGELGYDTTNKRIVIGDGSTLGGTKIPNYVDILTQEFTTGTVGGTADVITLTLPVAPASYTDLAVEFKASGTNTTTVTINVNSLGAKNIYMLKAGVLSALAAGDIVSGAIYRIAYDGTQFQIISGGGGGSTQASTAEVANETAVAEYVSPDRMTYHPRIPKAVAEVTGAGSGGSAIYQSGCTFSNIGGGGKFTFSTPMASTNYMVLVTLRDNGTKASLAPTINKTTGYVEVSNATGSRDISIAVYGAI